MLVVFGEAIHAAEMSHLNKSLLMYFWMLEMNKFMSL